MKKTRDEVLVGAFVIFGFILLSLVVFFVSGVSLVRRGYEVSIVFTYVSILDKGAPVRMAGVRVGEVSKVSLLEDKETGQTKVNVQVFIAKGHEIRENYLFNVRGTHILSEPHIEITPQPGRASFLKDGDILQGVDPVPMEVLVDRADQIAGHLEAMLGRLRNALEDKETEKSVRETIKNLSSLTSSLNKILGGSEKDMTEGLKHLNNSTQALERILTKIEKGEGTVGKLMSEEELYQEMRAFVQEIKTHPWRLLKREDKKDKKWIPFV
ncbi:MAG: MCE family protein [Candidatus Omnitrophica bacterium]|nr:MCE family protein [Candidatus Omnitrophota bacterium]